MDSTKAGVSKPKKAGAEQRQDRKRRRDEMQRKLAAEEDQGRQETIQKELKQLDEMDETWEQTVESNTDADTQVIKTEGPTAAAASLASVPAASGRAPTGDDNSNLDGNGAQPRAGDTAIQSVEGSSTESAIDLDSEPLLTGINRMRNRDEGLEGVPVESVGKRTRFYKAQKVPRDFINMHGPKHSARYTIDESAHLNGTVTVEQLLDVTNPLTRRIDNPTQRKTSADYVGITAVAWQCEPGLSIEARLALLDPVKVKLTNEYPTMKVRNKAIKDERIVLGRYPPTHVRVMWENDPSSWEMAVALRSLFSRNAVTMEDEIYNAACQQEENHEKWLDKERPDRKRSPTVEPSGIRNETPARDVARPSRPQAARARGEPTATQRPEPTRSQQGGLTYPTPSPERGTAAAASPNSAMKAFALKYKQARKLDANRKLSETEKADFMMEFQAYQALAEQFAGVDI
jgi:hypothetical protein